MPSTRWWIFLTNSYELFGSGADDIGAREPLCFTQRVIARQRAGTIGNRLDVPIGIKVEIRSVHVEPDLRIVLDALQRVD